MEINKKLPQIILPKDKIEMLINWWNTDIRFEKEVPHSFEEGYLFIEYGLNNDLIKSMAKTMKVTFRDAEKQLKHISEFIMYFKFTNENSIFIKVYNNEYKPVTKMALSFGESEEESEIDFKNVFEKIKVSKNFTEALNIINIVNRNLLITCLWYIATTSKRTKYIYEKQLPETNNKQKNIVMVSNIKNINTPIYDMNKIKIVKIDKLQARKRGWTYSHSFAVHGHYRHYKDGKVIFINSYIKGKEKEFKPQQFILKPKE